jgi:hypothetical protein
MTEKFNQKDWLNFIKELNDREISKRNSSGFTLWALFGLFGFILFKFLDSLPIIFADVKSEFLIILFFTNIFNFSIVVALFILTLVVPQSGRRKIITELSNKASTLNSILVNFIFIVGVICNIYIIIFSKHYGLSTISYYVFGIYAVINTIGMIIFDKIIVTKDNKMPKVDFGTYYSTKDKNPSKYIYGFICLALLCFLSLSVYQIIQSNYILNHLDLIKSSIYLSILIASTILFSYQLISNMRYEWLEQFERKIILKNLNEKEIVKIFINEFVGKDVIQWLKEIEDETKEEKGRITKLYNKLENEFSGLHQKEKDLNKRVIKAKKISENFKELSNSLNKHINKFSNNTDKVKHFLKQGPISVEEDLLIKAFINTRTKDNESLIKMNAKMETMIRELKKYINAIEESIVLKNK